jgi:ATP-dependent RNA helicase DDX5/DBP2
MTRDEFEPDFSTAGRFDDRPARSYGNDRRGGNSGGYGGGYGGGSSSYGSRGYGNESKGYGSRDGFAGSGLGAAPAPVDFSKLGPVVKDTYKEHDDVAGLTHEEIQQFRREAEMVIQGSNVPKPIGTFAQAGFPTPILRKLESQGFNKPTPIQAQGWPMAMSGRNMVGIAQTGSGKTLSFILPALLHIAAQPSAKYADGPLALVLAPTRELAIQIEEVARTYGNIMGIRNACVYGGAPKGGQARSLRGAQLVIATPGRLIDFLETHQTTLTHCSFLVLDEADRMLDMGFEPAIRKIVPQIRPERQVLLWSATWPKSVMRLARDILGHDYIQVNIGSQELAANKKIKQNVIVCENSEKEMHLAKILQSIWDAQPGDEATRQMPRIIVFANRKFVCDDLEYKMRQDQWAVNAIHGDKGQYEREAILRNFKAGHCPIMIATDVAARGIDVKDVQFVINFDFPSGVEDYVHRIGRTARGDAVEGASYALITRDDKGIVREFIGILEDAGQEVPQDLRAMMPHQGGANRGFGGGNNRRGGWNGGNRRGGHGGGSRGGYNNHRRY